MQKSWREKEKERERGERGRDDMAGPRTMQVY